jgi:Protein of unknown function (DUF1403)
MLRSALAYDSELLLFRPRFAEIPTESSFSPPPLPAWARARRDTPDDGNADFRAGATLAALDAILRAAPAFGGIWRSRLALSAAAKTRPTCATPGSCAAPAMIPAPPAATFMPGGC